MTGLVRKLGATIVFLSSAIIFASLVRDIGFSEESTRDVLPATFKFLVALSGAGLAIWLWRRKAGLGKRRLAVYFAVFGNCLVGAFITTVDYVDSQLSFRTFEGVYDDCHKIWATRGLVPEGPDITHGGTQNSISSIQLAFESGARGTEIDVQFDTGSGRFIVAHDVPYNLKNGQILTLESLFEHTGGRGYFWIDFKKLRKLNDEELRRSVHEMERLATKFDIKASIYVEGETPFSLAVYRDAGFHTIYDTHPRADSNPFTPAIIGLYKSVFYFGDFSVMAMNYGHPDDPKYGDRAQALLGNIPVFIYHVDEVEVAYRLLEIDAVRVIMLGDHSLNHYAANACTRDP